MFFEIQIRTWWKKPFVATQRGTKGGGEQFKRRVPGEQGSSSRLGTWSECWEPRKEAPVTLHSFQARPSNRIRSQACLLWCFP